MKKLLKALKIHSGWKSLTLAQKGCYAECVVWADVKGALIYDDYLETTHPVEFWVLERCFGIEAKRIEKYFEVFMERGLMQFREGTYWLTPGRR